VSWGPRLPEWYVAANIELAQMPQTLEGGVDQPFSTSSRMWLWLWPRCWTTTATTCCSWIRDQDTLSKGRGVDDQGRLGNNSPE